MFFGFYPVFFNLEEVGPRSINDRGNKLTHFSGRLFEASELAMVSASDSAQEESQTGLSKHSGFSLS